MQHDIEMTLANHDALLRNNQDDMARLAERVKALANRKTEGGIILPGPGGDAISRAEFNRYKTEAAAELKLVADVAFEAVRILDRMSGMGDDK